MGRADVNARFALVVLGGAVVLGACAEPRGAALERRAAALVWGAGQELVAGDAAELDELGRSVALTADRALLGAYGESAYRGAAYVFVRDGAGWTEEQKLVAGDGAERDKLGYAVALDGERALLGAYGADGARGAAYVFVRDGAGWTEEQKLVADDGAAGDNFGWSVALDGDRAVIGASGRDSGRGAAYVFVRDGAGWTREQRLAASDGAMTDAFGSAVSLDGERAAIGAPGRDGYRGAAHVFARSAGATPPWNEEQELVASDGAAFNSFGNAVSLDGDRVLVAAYWNDDLRGAAYVFARTGGAVAAPWTEEQKLVASDGAGGERFGGAVSLAAGGAVDRALVSALGPGVAYVFARSGGAWTEEQKLVPGGVPSMDLFGWSVALAGDHALAGASYTDQLRGAGWLYTLGGGDPGGDGGADAAGDGGADAAGDGPSDGGGDASDGGAPDAGPPGPGACIRGDDCASGHCEDGLCCDRTCAASERCRAELKVSGEDGVCGPAKAAAPGAPCKFDVQCTSGRCAATGADGTGPDRVCADVDADAGTDATPDACGSGDACVTGAETNRPGDDSGCGCRAGSAPAAGARAWLGLALALLLLGRRPAGVRRRARARPVSATARRPARSVARRDSRSAPPA